MNSTDFAFRGECGEMERLVRGRKRDESQLTLQLHS
jgi:hypothetical protein